MEFEQMIRLIESVSKSGLTEFDYEEGNLKLHMKNKQTKTAKIAEIPMTESYEKIEIEGTADSEPKTEPKPSVNEAFITSPIVGVFYTSPGPDSPPLLKRATGFRKDRLSVLWKR